MERLTIDLSDSGIDDIGYNNPNDPYGMYDILDLARLSECDDGTCANILLEISDRLFAYENSGLTPAEVAELAKAKAEGRLVVLPCKVGDTVYLIVHGYVEETKVRTFFFGHPSYSRGEPDPRYEMIRCTNYDVPMKNFGKTVFLTRKEAEKALKEREK